LPAEVKPITGKKPASGKRARKSRVPTAATLRALTELKAGKLNSYADEGELFKKLGIKEMTSNAWSPSFY
jgi:hypothetical protein